MTRIKLCGLTRPEDIAAANALQPEYSGFVFAPKSRRYVSRELAAELKAQLSPGIQAVGVFVNEAPETVAGLLNAGIIEIAQLHGQEDAAYIARLRGLTARPLWQAFRVTDAESLAKAEKSPADLVLLDSGAGIMGTVLVPKIGVELPIRHGTSEPVLAVGAGHLYGTSLPVGGTGSHTVVTGHRGLVKSLMFTRLDELHDGDFMYIKVMDETLGYEVDRISVIEPDDVSRLKIVPGEDRLTLMTCTPYGINTHRLLVSGHRVAIPLPAPDPADVRDERATELGALAMTIVCTMGGMLLCCMVVRSMRPRHRIMRHASTWPRKG